MSYTGGGSHFLSNETFMKIINDPRSQDLLFEFMELNLSLSDGSFVGVKNLFLKRILGISTTT